MNWNSPKLLTGFFTLIGLVLFAIAAYDLIGKGKFNATAVFLGLVMMLFAFRANEKEKLD